MIPIQKDFPPELLRRWRKIMREADKRPVSYQWIENWKLSQQRQSWLVAVIAGAVLCLLAFVVAGGCK